MKAAPRYAEAMTKLRIDARKSQSGLIFKVIDCFINGISIVGDGGH